MATRKDPPEQNGLRDLLTDEDGHFPYHADKARAALAAEPDPDTNNHPESWYTSGEIIDATEAYVAAQEKYYRTPDSANKDAMDAAAQVLVDARRAHRANRPEGVGALAGHPVEVVHALRRSAGRTPEQIAKHLNMDLSEVKRILGGEG